MISISMLQGFLRKRSSVAIRFCGNEIPKWFSHKSEGCSIKIELPRDWFSTDFLGFALSLVVDFAPWDMKVRCKYNFKTSNGESHEVSHYLYNLFTTDNILRSEEDSHGVFVWWSNNVFEEVVKGAQSLTAFYKLVTEVNVSFTVMDFFDPELNLLEKCGICLLYGKDAEMIKQRAL
ncbi:disease resistance protein RPP2B-like [Prunus dulcis]|uniref:disease resistance protein RPP2B-like n=1 Tax=Prunus dulcis TaxID=3755 RepID=UPI0014823C3D|nr:disease resistance protein RPP2B-like [Prunus dulcis]